MSESANKSKTWNENRIIRNRVGFGGRAADKVKSHRSAPKEPFPPMGQNDAMTLMAGLIEALAGQDEAAREEACEQLLDEAARLGLAAAAPLLAGLDHGDAHVRQAAAAALGEIGTVEGPPSARIVAALRDEDATVRGNAALTLGAMGRKAYGALDELSYALGMEEDDWASAMIYESIRRIRGR